MSFIHGYMSLVSAITGNTITEAPGIARAPCTFAVPRDGVSVLQSPVQFPFGAGGTSLVGRAIFDAAGSLLLVLPFAAPRSFDRALHHYEPDALRLVFTTMRPFADGAAYSGTLASGTVAGLCYEPVLDVGPPIEVDRNAPVDPNDVGVIWPYRLVGDRRKVVVAPMTAGVNLTIARGTLYATGT